MAVALNRLVTGNSGGSSSTTTASFTPATNSLVLCFIVCDDFSSGPNVVVNNGNGLTWVNMYDANIYLINSINSAGLWRAMASSPSSGGISISANCTFQYDIIEFTGVDTSGTNGSGAVVQDSQFGGGPGPDNVTFSSPTNSSNAIVGFLGAHDSGVTITLGSGFTLIDSGNTISNIWKSQWKNGVSQSVCDFATDAGSCRVFGLEVGAGGGSPPPTVGSPSGLVVGAGF